FFLAGVGIRDRYVTGVQTCALPILRMRRPIGRTGTALAFALAGFGFSALLRSEGMTGAYKLDAHWRWSPTAESLVLARRQSDAAGRMNNAVSGKTADKPGEKYANSFAQPEWPGFRGPDRAGRVVGPP